MPRRRRAKVVAERRAPADEVPSRGLRSDVAAIGGLVALHLAFFWRAALLRGFLIHSDICYFFEPAKSLLHDSLRAGRLPLWSPYIFCGYPAAAEGQIAAFYPLSLLISWLLPSPGAINWLVISHLLIAAVGMYLLARLLGLSPFSAWLSAFTFSFSGYLFAHIHHISLLCSACWLPLIIYFVERAWRGALLPNALLAAGAWAASALSGHPQTLFHIGLVTLFWVLWRWLGAGRTDRRSGLRRAGLVLGAVFALGFGLSAVQLLLTFGLAAAAPHGERGSLAYVTSFSLLPKHLFGLVAPNWQGTPAYNSYHGENYYWEYVLYLGLVPLALALVGVTRRRAWALAGLCAAALILALAEGNPVYQVLRFVPGFADFRVPARFIFLYTFGASLLAGFGWEALAGWRPLAPGGRLLALGSLVCVFSVCDLVWFDRTLAPLTDPQILGAPNPVVEALRADHGWWRALIVPPSTIDAKWVPPGGWAANPDGWIEARLLLPADVPQSYRLRTIGGYAGFTDPQQALFFGSAYTAAQSGDLRLLSLVGTRYLALPPQASLPSVPATQVGPFVLYRNADAFPRAFLVSQTVSSRDAADAHRRTVELGRAGRLSRAAVVQGRITPFTSQPDLAAKITVEEPRPERIVVHTRSARDSLLVLNERYDRGWRVRADGRPAELATVDTVLMGTALPRGEHSVEFLYRPRTFIIGRTISLAFLVLWVGLLAAPRVRRRSG